MRDGPSLRGRANAWFMRRIVKPRMSKPTVPEQTLEEQRRGFESIPFVKPPKGTVVESLKIDELEAERVTPPGANKERALLWFFGGGYCLGSPASTRGVAARIAAVVDGFGRPRERLCALRDAGDPLPAAAAMVSPWTDLAMTGASIEKNAGSDAIFSADTFGRMMKTNLASVTDPLDPRSSPLYADLSDLPPLIIHVSATEMLLDDSVRFAERARSAGVDVKLRVFPGLWHGFPASSGVPEAARAINEIADFALARLQRAGTGAGMRT